MGTTTGELRPGQSGYRSNDPVPETDNPEVIRAQIEETRASMTQTLNEIQDRLAPERLRQEAKDAVREATIGKVETMANDVKYKARSWRTNVVETVKENPIPAALIGIGLGWLIVESSNSGARRQQYRNYPEDYTQGYGRGYPAQRYYPGPEPGVTDEARRLAQGAAHDVQTRVRDAQEKVSETASEVQERVREAASDVQEGASHMVDRAREQAEELTHQVQHQVEDLREEVRYRAQQAKTGMQQMLEENPLAVGVLALAVGAIVGMSLPATTRENEMLGETRDRLVHQAQTTAQETMEKVRHVAEEAQQAAVDAAKREAEKEDLPLPETERESIGEGRF